ncbi:MAG: hypothetical protein KIT22_05035, partial [Verrucomicrobiae bacterium]|nr:hypothetical protein [Verrucomicrobiae bacterium]
DTSGSDFDTLLAIYTGDAVSALSPVTANDDAPFSRTSEVRFNARPGATYQIAVDGYHGSAGNISLGLRATPAGDAPPNDNFADRAPLTGSVVTLTATNHWATREPGEPSHADTIGGSSVWWTWTAPESGVVTIATSGSDFDTVLAVYTGDAVSALSLVTANDDATLTRTSLVRFTVRPGTPYQIVVDSYDGSAGNISLSLRLAEPGAAPPNDAFANRTPLTGSIITLAATNDWAAREAGEPLHAGASGGSSVWWTWTAPETGPVTINTSGSDFDTVLAVYTGNVLPALSLVAANDDVSFGTRSSLVDFAAQAGTAYQIAVDGYSGEFGSITLNLVQVGTQPSSDDFATATVIEGLSATVASSNVTATKEPREPNHAGNRGGRSVWWRWTAPQNAVVTVFTEGSNFDTILGIYTGDQVAALSEVESNDDSGWDLLTSATTFTAVEGVTYYFAVDGYRDSGVTDSGTVVLSLLPLAEAADNPALEWTVSGAHYVWHAQRGVAHDGQDALRSGFITDDEVSTLGTTVIGPGTLRFWWKVSSEEDFDFLTFRLDGSELAAISGEQNWHPLEFEIPEGTHSLTWSYRKDEAEGDGADAGWLDEVRFTGVGNPPQITAGPLGQTVNPGAAVTLSVAATGAAPLAYVWRRNGEAVAGGNAATLLLPDFQPAGVGDYTVEVTNPFGSDTSNPAHVALLATESIVVQPLVSAAPGFRFTATVQPGRDYRVQAAGDFRQWTDLLRFTSAGTEFEYTDPVAAGLPWRFYRIVSP